MRVKGHFRYFAYLLTQKAGRTSRSVRVFVLKLITCHGTITKGLIYLLAVIFLIFAAFSNISTISPGMSVPKITTGKEIGN